VMVKLPNGKSNPHVAASKGADNGIMDFYSTEYSSKHGIHGFLPRIVKHSGTGYKSNFRPGVYYSRKLDDIDNPAMGRILKDNYLSSMHESFRPYEGPDGKDPFAKDISDRHTGFTSNHPRTRNDMGTVKSAPPNLAGRKQNGFDNIYMSENHSQYQQKNPLVDASGMAVGRFKEMSGFTHAKNIEPVTHHPDEYYGGESRMNLVRPTGESVTKTSYLPSRLTRGDEKFRNIAGNADTDNGFTRFIRPTTDMTAVKDPYTRVGDLNKNVRKKIMKHDPCEYLNLLHPYPYKSMKEVSLQGKQVNDDTLMSDKMNSLDIGEKEDTGYSSNNKGLTCFPSERMQHSTYEEEFYNKNKKVASNVLREGMGTPTGNGYTKNEKVHTTGSNMQTVCNNVHPYVSRSLKARDPFYGEKIYEHKKISKLCST